MLNRQLVFDTVTSHLLRQGKVSTKTRPSFDIINGTKNVDYCAYRGDDGTKCALGCLISDESYNEHLEGKTVYNLDVNVIDKQYGSLRSYSEDTMFLRGLQHVHDNCIKLDPKNVKVFIESVINGLAYTAMSYNLDTFVLVNCVRALAQSGAI